MAHILHVAHPVVDSLICKSGTRIVATAGSAFPVNGKLVTSGDVLGNDCAGLPRDDNLGLKAEKGAGLSTVLAAEGVGKWPDVSKGPAWQLGGLGKLESRYHDWGRSKEERDQFIIETMVRKPTDYDACSTHWNGRKCQQLGVVRGKWLAQNPGWWEEKRREAEVDASPQVAGEMTDMGLDHKTIVAGHLAKTVEGGEVVEIRAVSSTSVLVNACYDAELGNMSVIPYACLGFGGNFVGVGGQCGRLCTRTTALLLLPPPLHNISVK